MCACVCLACGLVALKVWFTCLTSLGSKYHTNWPHNCLKSLASVGVTQPQVSLVTRDHTQMLCTLCTFLASGFLSPQYHWVSIGLIVLWS